MSGWEVAKQAREINPTFPIVYITGTANDWPSHGVPNSLLLGEAVRSLATCDSGCSTFERPTFESKLDAERFHICD